MMLSLNSGIDWLSGQLASQGFARVPIPREYRVGHGLPMVRHHCGGMGPATTATTSDSQVPFQVFQGFRATLHTFSNGAVIHSFADANKHITRKTETQSHVNTVLSNSIKNPMSRASGTSVRFRCRSVDQRSALRIQGHNQGAKREPPITAKR